MPNFSVACNAVALLLLCALLVGCGGSDDEAPAAAAPAVSIVGDKANVTTPKGPVQGVVDSNTLRFRGIPYALAPTGERRWKPPVAAAAWTTTLDASSYGKFCPQEGSPLSSQPNASEDCLNLDVYVPKAFATDTTAKPPDG